MTTKGYLFCVFMVIIAAMSWIRAATPAQAASSPTFEYTFVDDPLRSDEASRILNSAGAKGWRYAGEICILHVENTATDCHQPVFMRQR